MADALPRMPTLAEIYCSQHGCAPGEFRRRVFWRTLHWQSLPFVPLLLLGDYFEPDRRLIDACARATRMRDVYEDIRDHSSTISNAGWFRRCLKVRLSTRRLRQLAARYLRSEAAR